MGHTYSKQLVHQPPSFATPYTPSAGGFVADDEQKKWRSYDYVIVGGGTAGCVLASRLSEDSRNTVLLVEAGNSHENSFFSRIPMAFLRLFRSLFDWNYATTPQAALGGRSIYWPRGKMLGGTSSLNAMIYHRCDPSDFDSWEEHGATGWGYASLRTYFIKAEKHIPSPSQPVDLTEHGSHGPLATTHVPIAPVCCKFLEAAEALGIPTLNDLNTSGGTLGAAPFVATVDEKHERSSTATAYISNDVLKRPNLTVAVSTMTEKVLFAKTPDGTPKAIGIQISSSRSGPRFAVAADKEVILCAGIVGSPQILQLSGIGDAAHLAEQGIPLVRDLPAVGRNMLDHVSSGALMFRARAGWTWDYLTQNPLRAAIALAQWTFSGTGPMSSLAFQVGLFVRTDDERLPFGPSLAIKDRASGPRAPDLEFALVPFAVVNQGLWYPPYLADESDMNVLIRSTRFLLHLARTPPLPDVLDLRTSTAKGDMFWPGDADPDKITDEEVKEFIRDYGQSTWHPTSSVRMGSDPKTSAVDPNLRVHGVEALRVMDASVFPDQVSGHPCAVVVAMAERAADLIQDEEL
ncbi:GMC oxidoreductase [Cubamyces lactineus]|nr:GMC oxidoreductase [Cubamyces lactineus]